MILILISSNLYLQRITYQQTGHILYIVTLISVVTVYLLFCTYFSCTGRMSYNFEKSHCSPNSSTSPERAKRTLKHKPPARQNTMKLLKSLQMIHAEKRKAIQAKRWEKTIELEKERNPDLTSKPSLSSVTEILGRGRATQETRVKYTEHVTKPPREHVTRELEDVVALPNEISVPIPQEEAVTPITPAPEDKAESMLQGSKTKWHSINVKNSEKFHMATAQEKILLMNRVVGKIKYEGRVNVESIIFHLYDIQGIASGPKYVHFTVYAFG